MTRSIRELQELFLRNTQERAEEIWFRLANENPYLALSVRQRMAASVLDRTSAPATVTLNQVNINEVAKMDPREAARIYSQVMTGHVELAAIEHDDPADPLESAEGAP